MICNSAGIYSRKNLLSGPIGGLASSLTYVCKCIFQFYTDISSNYILLEMTIISILFLALSLYQRLTLMLWMLWLRTESYWFFCLF